MTAKDRVRGRQAPPPLETRIRAASASEPVETRFRWRPQLRDAGDEMVLEAAINGMAEGLVTDNVRPFAAASLRFGLRVLMPAELLSEVAQ